MRMRTRRGGGDRIQRAPHESRNDGAEQRAGASTAKPVLDLVAPLISELSRGDGDRGHGNRGGGGGALRDVRLFTVGRLDVNTTGLLLITNDGDWCNRVMHPSSNIEREYLATLVDRPSRRQLGLLARGTEVEGRLVTPLEVRAEETGNGGNGGSRPRVYITVAEGRYHEIKELVRAAGMQLRTLKRIRIGGLRLSGLDLREGEYKVLRPELANAAFSSEFSIKK